MFMKVHRNSNAVVFFGIHFNGVHDAMCAYAFMGNGSGDCPRRGYSVEWSDKEVNTNKVVLWKNDGSYMSGDYSTNLSSVTKNNDTSWHTFEMRYFSPPPGSYRLNILMDGTSIITNNDSTSFTTKYVFLASTGEWTGTITEYDLVYVRKYNNPEPTTSLGTEQLNQ